MSIDRDPVTPRPRRGRAPERRNEQARLAVLRAADDLLVERGFAGVTIEGIAARAGVAKQTIYRWWPSKVEILLETAREDADAALTVPELATVREELGERLWRLARFLRADAGQVLRALIGYAQHDPATARRLNEEFHAIQRAQDRARVRRAIDSGELPAGLVPDDALDALYGPIYFRALITGTRVPRRWVDQLLDDVLGSAPGAPVTVRPRRSRPK